MKCFACSIKIYDGVLRFLLWNLEYQMPKFALYEDDISFLLNSKFFLIEYIGNKELITIELVLSSVKEIISEKGSETGTRKVLELQ